MIGSVNIQTSEFTKICFAVTMSKHLAKLGEDLNKPKNILFVLIHFLAYLVPILLQGDIGTALYLHRNICRSCICGGNILQIFLSARFRGCGHYPAALEHDERLSETAYSFYGFQPELDPLGKGYQPLVSRMAIGSGQLWGARLSKRHSGAEFRFFPKSEPTSYMPLS